MLPSLKALGFRMKSTIAYGEVLDGMPGEIVGSRLIDSLRWRPALTAGNYIEAGWNVNSIVLQACSRPADCCTLSMMSRPIFRSNPKGSVMR